MNMQLLTLLAKEDQPDHAEGIKGCQTCSNQHQDICPNWRTLKTCFENQFLAPKSIEDWNTGQCKCADDKHVAHKRHFVAERTNAAHIARANTMNDRTGRQEQQGFEHCVTQQVELTGEHTARTNRIYHIAKLADR